MEQVARNLIDDFSGFLREKRSLIHDRNPLFTRGFRELLQSAGVTSVWMPQRSPNLNAFAERFVLSIESECLNRLVILGERIQTAATVYVRTRKSLSGGNYGLCSRDSFIKKMQIHLEQALSSIGAITWQICFPRLRLWTIM
jgi:hypothetical protein